MSTAHDHPWRDTVDILRGAGAALGGFLIRSGARIIFLFLAGNLYGAERLGTMAYAVAVVEVLAAVAVFGQKRSLFSLLDSDRGKEAHLILNALGVTGAISFTFALGLFLVWPLIDMPGGGPWRAFALVIPLIALSDVLLATTRHQRFMRYEVYARSIAEPWTLAAVAAICHFAGFHDGGLLASYFLSLTVAFAVALWALSRVHGVRRVLGGAFSRSTMKRVCTRSGPVAVVDIVALVFRRVDIFFLWFFSTEAIVGIYHAAQHVGTIIEKIRHVFDPILAPIQSQTLSQHGAEEAGRQLARVCRWIVILLLGPIMVLGYYSETVLRLIGPGMQAGATVLVIMLLAEAVESAFASAELPILFQRPGLNMRLAIAGIVLHISLCAALVPIYGAYGAVGSLLVSLTLLNAARMVTAWKLFGIRTIRKGLIAPAAAAAVTLLIVSQIDAAIGLTGNFGAPLGAVLLFGGYLLILRLIGPGKDDRALLAYLKSVRDKT